MTNGMKLLSIAISIVMLNIFEYDMNDKNLMGHGEKVLIIGRHADMLAKVTDMLKLHGYNSIGKLTNDEAMLTFKSESIDAVIIGGGVDTKSRDFFHTEFPKINPHVKIIDAHPLTVLSNLKNVFPDK